MKITVESTTQIVHVNGTAARIWAGTTEAGVPLHAIILRVAVANDQDNAQFERELIEMKPPSPDIARTYGTDPRLVM